MTFYKILLLFHLFLREILILLEICRSKIYNHFSPLEVIIITNKQRFAFKQIKRTSLLIILFIDFKKNIGTLKIIHSELLMYQIDFNGGSFYFKMKTKNNSTIYLFFKYKNEKYLNEYIL